MWFNFEVIDQRARDLGIKTDVALADLVDLNRSSIFRFRRREIQPSLETAMRVAERLGLAVEQVISHEKAA